MLASRPPGVSPQRCSPLCGWAGVSWSQEGKLGSFCLLMVEHVGPASSLVFRLHVLAGRAISSPASWRRGPWAACHPQTRSSCHFLFLLCLLPHLWALSTVSPSALSAALPVSAGSPPQPFRLQEVCPSVFPGQDDWTGFTFPPGFLPRSDAHPRMAGFLQEGPPRDFVCALCNFLFPPDSRSPAL